MDYATYILIGIVIFIASFVQGFGGFGFSMIAIPILSLFVGVKYAVALGALCGFLINVVLLVQLKKYVKFFDFKRLLWGSVLGIPVGVYFLSYFPQHIMKMILAFFIMGFVAMNFLKVKSKKGVNLVWGYVAGFISGIFGGAFNTNGPPVLVYFYLQSWDKNKQKAALTGFFFFSSVVIIFSQIIFGITNFTMVKESLFLSPFSVLGILLGSSLFGKISTEQYNKFIIVALFFIAIFLLVV